MMNCLPLLLSRTCLPLHACLNCWRKLCPSISSLIPIPIPSFLPYRSLFSITLPYSTSRPEPPPALTPSTSAVTRLSLPRHSSPRLSLPQYTNISLSRWQGVASRSALFLLYRITSHYSILLSSTLALPCLASPRALHTAHLTLLHQHVHPPFRTDSPGPKTPQAHP